MTDLAAALLRDVPIHGRIYTGGNCLDELVCKKDVLAALTAALEGVDERAGEIVSELREVAAVFTKDTVFTDAADLITALLAQNAALRARLEIDHYWVFRDDQLVRVAGDPGVDGIECRDATIKELEEQLAALRAERDETYAYAKHLAEAMFANGKFDAPQWEPLEDTLGVLTQIDNMAAGIRARAEAAEAERDALLGAVKGLVEVLDQHETKGPLPDTALMFCWLAAQNVRAVLRGYMLEKPE